MIFLRKVTEADLPLIFAWEKNPVINQGFYTSRDDMDWQRHLKYWRHDIVNWDAYLICLLENNEVRPIGQLRIALLDYWSPEIGYQIGETTLWGKGYGKEAVRQSLEILKERGYEYCHTTVLNDNERSMRLLESLGFTRLGDARKGESWWQKKL